MTLQKNASNGAKTNAAPADVDAVDQLLSRSSPAAKPTRRPLVLWLVATSMIVFFLPLYLFSMSVNEDTKGLTTDLGFIRTSLTQVPTPAPAVEKLLTPLAQSQAQLSQVNALRPTIAAPRPNWPAVMAAIGNYNPDQITLTAISRTQTTLSISGRAAQDSVLSAYVQALEQSGQFSQVVVQSIHASVTTPTATLAQSSTPAPAPTGTPAAVAPTAPPPTSVPAPIVINPPTAAPTVQQSTATPVATATADGRDAYEPDEGQPKPIALAQAQTHNFYPSGDVDSVSFLAKAGQFYHVYTTNLASGVDTYLSVRVGSVVLNNDDVSSGSLYSGVVIQNTGPDVTAVASIANRGIYGTDMTYDIVVEQVAATPTPLPAATSTRTPTITPTPNLGDGYEPDDTNGKVISVGETQAHTFAPAGDVDKVVFMVKQDRYYQVLTSGLALGVDTIATVDFEGQSAEYQNDDYQTGAGNFASSVCFQSAQDDTATATIVNKAKQYGSDKKYSVKVTEISDLTSSQCTLTQQLRASLAPPAKAVRGLAAP
ncbi:MAG: PilN domain-containing protein, partial [Chloroflexi bacterium]|nr:PilN domain-containing protein [Chloroflexota bacterium]